MWLDIRRPWLDRKPGWVPERGPRARYVDLLVRNPERARREKLRAAREYWRHRVELLEGRLAAAEGALAAALEPPPEDDAERPLLPPAELWRLRCEVTVAWADVRHAKAQAEALDRELERR